MNDPCTVYVTGVPVSMNTSGFRNLFSRCGVVGSVSLLPPKGNFNSAAGFVDYGSRMEGVKAIQMFDNFKIGEETLKVTFAKKKSELVPSMNNAKIDLSSIVKRNIEQSTKKATERFKRSDSAPVKSDRFPCTVCKNLCVATCMSCKSVNYCGSSCQKEDWPKHKLECDKLAAKHQHSKQASLSTLAEKTSVSLVEDFDVEVGDTLVNELASRVKSCVDVKRQANLIATPSINHFDVPFPVKPGNHLQVQLIDLSLSGDIFCMVPTDEASSSKLDPLHHHYSNENTETPSVVEVGQYYACMFSGDKQWYRACILDMSEDGHMCSVWFVDYGNCEDTETSNLRVLTETFASIPMRTVRCRLSGCDKVGNSCIREYLTQELCDPVVEVEIVKILGTVAYVQMYGLASGKLCFINEFVVQRYAPKVDENPLKPDLGIQESPKINQMVGLKTPPISAAESTTNPVVITPTTSPAFLPSLTAEIVLNPSSMSHGSSGAVCASIPPAVTSPNERNVSSDSTLSPRMLINTIKEGVKAEPIQDLDQVAVEATMDKLTVNDTIPRKSPSKLHSVFNKIRAKALDSTQGMFLQELNVPTGKFQAIITHVVSIEELYLSIFFKQNHLNEFHSALKVACDKNFTLQPYKKGAACVFLDDTSGKWHRGKIIAQDGNKKMKILLMDYGLEQTVSYLKVGKLPAEQKFWVPPKAIPCKLKGCSNGSPEYNKECVNLLKQCENEPVTAEVIGEPINGVYAVTLYMEDSITVNWCINKLREEFECDDSPMPVTAVIQKMPSHSDKPPATLHSNDDVQSEKEVIVEQGSNSKEKKVTLNMITPTIGVEIDVVIVHVVSPSEFYCQIIADDLKNLFMQLAQLHNGAVELKELDVFEIGQICVACASDNQLYRAEITSVENGSCGVLFVDYGNFEMVPNNKIVQIPPGLTKLYAQAIKCRLHDCIPNEKTWSQDCVDAMKGLNDQSVKAIFTGQRQDGYHEVKILFDDGIDVSSILIDQAMAKKDDGIERDSDKDIVVSNRDRVVIEKGEVTLPEVTGSANEQFKVKLSSKEPFLIFGVVLLIYNCYHAELIAFLFLLTSLT